MAWQPATEELLLVTQARKGIPYPQLLATPTKSAFLLQFLLTSWLNSKNGGEVESEWELGADCLKGSDY
jgi:hypothetical protein